MNKLKKKYKHVIWDWNGTLLDDVEYCLMVMNAMLKKRNMATMSMDYYKKIFDFPVRDYYQRVGFDFEKDPFKVVGTEFIVNYHKNSHQCPLQSGARSVLQTISDNGISQSVLSAMNQLALQALIRLHNLEDFFIKIIGLDDHYAAGKVENGKNWIKELHYNPDHVLLIGDTFHDYEVAQEMGIDSILVTIGHHPREKLSKWDVPVLDSLEELLKIVL